MYHKQGTDLVNVDKELVRKQGTKVIQRDFSKIVDGKIRHDSDAISLAIMQIVLSDIRYSLKDKKVMTLALEAVLRKHKKIQNIKDRKLRKAEKNTRKKNDKLVKKLRKQGKTEKEIQDIIFREISTKEELINNIEQKERQKVKGESATSRFIEKYNDRINAIIEKKAINNTAPNNVIKDSHVDIKDSELPEKKSTNVRIYNISFTVDTKGSVSSLNVTHIKDTLYNQKNLQEIERMSKPDNTKNKTIKAIYNLPISFKL